MANVALFVKIPVQPGKAGDLIAAMAPMLDHVGSESGTLHYGLFTSDAEPDTVRLFELYEDQAALDAHMNSDVMKSLFVKLADYASGAPEMVFASPAPGAKNLGS